MEIVAKPGRRFRNVFYRRKKKPETGNIHPSRIKSIDGWRAIAALGVLYTHSWGAMKFPTFHIGPVDLLRVINLLGNGVHLFFVISGFCFYFLMRKETSYTIKTAIGFWKRRWLRIAPAFYVVCLFYLARKGFVSGASSVLNVQTLVALIANYSFIQNQVHVVEISAIFWSLAVEWHFYLLLPLIFYFLSKKGVLPTLSLILGFCLFINLLHYYNILMPGDDWWYRIFANLEHFMWGILIAYLFTTNKTPRIMKSAFFFIIAAATAYFGKILFTSDFVQKTGSLAGFFKAIGPLVMTFGFGLLILNSLVNQRIHRLIGNRVLVFIGKISFSFYLWHALMLDITLSIFGKWLPNGTLGLVCLFFLILAFTVPVSYLSYQLFEKPYFNKRHS